MTRWRRWLGRVLALLASSGLALITLEAGVRLIVPQQPIQLRPDIWQPDADGLGWRQRDGIDTLVNTGERTVRLKTGEHGHRVSPASTPAPALRVLALGDSFLVGIQVDYADLFAAHLERLLSDRFAVPVEIVNTGVGGWGPSHYLLEARRELRRQRFDAILVALFAGNDVELKRIDHFAPKTAEVRHRLRWPGSFTRRELIGALAYPLNDALERHSHSFLLVREVLWKQLMRFGLSARRLPDALLETEAVSPRWGVTAAVLDDLAALGRREGIPVVFALIPGAYQVDTKLAIEYASAIGVAADQLDLGQPSRLLGDAMRARGLGMIDLLPALRLARAQGGAPLFGHLDTHLAPEGHAVVAETLLPELAQAIERSQGP